jgi:hypothetical protein
MNWAAQHTARIHVERDRSAGATSRELLACVLAESSTDTSPATGGPAPAPVPGETVTVSPLATSLPSTIADDT